MAKPPESTKTSLRQKLAARAAERWPQLAGVSVRWHGQFAYVSGQLHDGTELPLFRLRYAGSASTWGFAIYRASHDDYERSILPSGWPAGTPQEALDCACGLYLGDHTAWLTPPAPDELTGASTRRSLSSRSQVAIRTACVAARLTWKAPSVNVRWRPSLAMAIVTHLVTCPVSMIGGSGPVDLPNFRRLRKSRRVHYSLADRATQLVHTSRRPGLVSGVHDRC